MKLYVLYAINLLLVFHCKNKVSGNKVPVKVKRKGECGSRGHVHFEMGRPARVQVSKFSCSVIFRY